MIRSALLGGSCHKAIFPLSLGMGLRLGLGANQTGGGAGPTPPAGGTPTISGTAQMESTLTATADPLYGAPISWRWQSNAYNAGVPNPLTWADISGATASTKLLDGNQKLLVVRVVATYSDGDYPSDWVGQVMPFYSSTGFSSGQVLRTAANAANGFLLKSNIAGNTEKDKLVANKGGLGNFGVSSQLTSTASMALQYDDVGTNDQRIQTRLRGVPSAGAAYCALFLRMSGADGSPFSYLRIFVQTNGFILQTIINNTTSGSSQTLNSGGLSIGTLMAGYLLDVQVIANKIYISIETSAGSGVFNALTPAGGTTLTTAAVSGTECAVNSSAGAGTGGFIWDEVALMPIAQGIAGVSATTQDVDFTPSNQRAVVTGTVVGISNIADLELRIETTSGGTTVFDYAQDADNTLASGAMAMYSATSLAAYQGVSLTAKVRNKATLVVLASVTFTPAIEALPQTPMFSMNVTDSMVFEDLIMSTSLIANVTEVGTASPTGDKIIAFPGVVVNTATCDQYRDSSYLSCDAKGRPSGTYPATVNNVSLRHIHSYDRAILGGRYNVEFTPGWDWDLQQPGGVAWSIVGGTYNKDAGTAQIDVSSVTSSTVPIYIRLKGFGLGTATARVFPPQADQYFRMRKTTAPVGKIIRQEYKDSVAAVVTPGAFIRAMNPNKVNRESITGITYNPSNDAAPTGLDYQTFLDTYIKEEAGEGLAGQYFGEPMLPLRGFLELAEDIGCHVYWNSGDLMTDAAITKVATFFHNERAAGTKIGVCNSNENGWNYVSFARQSTLTNNRAIAAGIPASTQSALDTNRVHDLFHAVTGGTDIEYIVEWRYQGLDQSTATAMLTAAPRSRRFHTGPYGSNGVTYQGVTYDSSTYTGAFAAAALLMVSDATAGKAAWDAALRAGGAATLNVACEQANIIARASIAVHGDKRVVWGTYEHDAQHTNIASYPDPPRVAALAELLSYYRSSAWGDTEVWYASKIGKIGGILGKFDLTGVHSAGIYWSQFDNIGDEAQSPNAEYATYIATL